MEGRVPGADQLQHDEPEEQLREIEKVLPLRLVNPLSRCSLCNEVLVPASLEEVKEVVPDGVRSRHQAFWRCPSCRRVYWQGSHWNKLAERLNELRLPSA